MGKVRCALLKVSGALLNVIFASKINSFKLSFNPGIQLSWSYVTIIEEKEECKSAKENGEDCFRHVINVYRKLSNTFASHRIVVRPSDPVDNVCSQIIQTECTSIASC